MKIYHMKKNFIIPICLCTIILLSNFTCHKSKNSSPCSTQTICTQEFRTVSVHVVNSQEQAVTNAQVKTLIGGETLTFDKNTNDNSYVIITDASLLALRATTKTATVQVFINNVEVKSETYQLAADCCHVFKQSGVDVIVIN